MDCSIAYNLFSINSEWQLLKVDCLVCARLRGRIMYNTAWQRRLETIPCDLEIDGQSSFLSYMRRFAELRFSI